MTMQRLRKRELYDVTDLEPQVAIPHNVDQGVPGSKVEGTHIDQVFIGSCTNGRYEDLAEAAKVLGKKKFNPKTRVIIIPASRDEYLKALEKGLIERFVKAGVLSSAVLRAVHGGIIWPACTRGGLSLDIKPEL